MDDLILIFLHMQPLEGDPNHAMHQHSTSPEEQPHGNVRKGIQ